MNNNETDTDLNKVFMQSMKNPCPTKYVHHKNWKDSKNVAPGGKILKKERVTFTQEIMRTSKKLYADKDGLTHEGRVIDEKKVKVPCPGWYKESEVPKETRILGCAPVTTKDARPKNEWVPALVQENKEMPDTCTKVYVTPAPNQKTKRDGVTHTWHVADAEVSFYY